MTTIRRYVDKPQIPALTGMAEELQKVIAPLKQTVEVIAGRRGQRIAQLAGTVTVDQMAERINEIIRVMQDGQDTAVNVLGNTTTPADATPTVNVTNVTEELVTYLSQTFIGTVETEYDLIVNGEMQVGQRYTSGGVETSGVSATDNDRVFGPDRFALTSWSTSDRAKISKTASGAFVDSQNVTHAAYLKVERGSSWASGSAVLKVRHGVEGANYRPYASRSVELNFMVYSSVAGTYSLVALLPSYSGLRRTIYLTSYTISAANTWEEKTITITAPPSSAVQYIGDTTSGIEFYWVVKGGQLSATGLNSWVADDTNYHDRSVPAQANALSSAGYEFRLTGVHTRGVRRSLSEEAIACRRFYRQSAAAGSTAYNTNGAIYAGTEKTSASGKTRLWLPFDPPMVRAPSITTYRPGSSTAGKLGRLVDNTDITGLNAAAALSENGHSWEATTSDADSGVSFTYTAESEMV